MHVFPQHPYKGCAAEADRVRTEMALSHFIIADVVNREHRSFKKCRGLSWEPQAYWMYIFILAVGF